MKKIRIILICTVAIAFACVIFAGCSKTEQISSIGLKDHDADNAIEFQIGKFDYTAHTVIVNYDSGSVVEVALSEEMISELDRLKFYQPGEHTITVSHGGKSCEVKISVKRDTFGELYFPENTVFTYDGKTHTIELEGELPSHATVSYVGGNSFVNAGSYNVTAVVSCNGYVTERITTTVTIQRAKYDMSNVKFESKNFVYDGKAHSIEISGTLPNGVSAPTYYINGSTNVSAVDAGQYTVTAVFPNGDPNYETVPTMTATLNIEPAEYSLGEIDLIFKDEKGSAYIIPYKSYDGNKVTFDLADSRALNNKVTVSYAVYNEEGDVISVSNTDTKIINAGTYTVEVKFALLDNRNYKPIEPYVCEFEVAKAELDTSELDLEWKIVRYNGKIHSLSLSIPDGLDVTKFDVDYEYYLFGDDKIIKNGDENADGVIAAGEYTVRAVFTVNDPNYKAIPSLEAKLVVEKKQVPVSGFGLYNTNLEYNGSSQTPLIYQNIMREYVCELCGWEYDEEMGAPEYKIDPGTKIDDLPNNSQCLACHKNGFVEEAYVAISALSISKISGTGYFGVNEAKDAGSYLGSFTVSLTDPHNYVFDNGETSVEITSGFTIIQKLISISHLGFMEDNPSLVVAGEGASFRFNTASVAGLSFKAEFFNKLEDGKLSDAIDPMTVTYEDGTMIVGVDTFGLEVGSYVCRVTVSAEEPNCVLSSGNATAEYDFEFKIAN